MLERKDENSHANQRERKKREDAGVISRRGGGILKGTKKKGKLKATLRRNNRI